MIKSSPARSGHCIPHQDIESLTYVVEGSFLHADSLGNNGRLEPAAAQAMTFSHGGDLHSEKNGSPDRRCASSSSGSCRAFEASTRG